MVCRSDVFSIAYSPHRPRYGLTMESMTSTLTTADAEPGETPQADENALHPGRVPLFAHTLSFAVWLIGMGAAAAAASFLLLYERIQLWQNPDHVTACDVNPWVSCGEVMQSWQASTFGFPNIFIGVIGFPLLIAVGVSLLAAKASLPRWYHLGLQAGVTFAFGFCIWLWTSAVFIIGVLCPYCMVVWAAMIPAFVVTTSRNLIYGVIPASPRVRQLAAEWWWVAIVVLYLLVFASILLNFTEAFTYSL